MDDWEVRLTVEEMREILDNLPEDSEIVFQGLDECKLEFHRCNVEKEGFVRFELRNPDLYPRSTLERRSKDLFFSQPRK